MVHIGHRGLPADRVCTQRTLAGAKGQGVKRHAEHATAQDQFNGPEGERPALEASDGELAWRAGSTSVLRKFESALGTSFRDWYRWLASRTDVRDGQLVWGQAQRGAAPSVLVYRGTRVPLSLLDRLSAAEAQVVKHVQGQWELDGVPRKAFMAYYDTWVQQHPLEPFSSAYFEEWLQLAQAALVDGQSLASVLPTLAQLLDLAETATHGTSAPHDPVGRGRRACAQGRLARGLRGLGPAGVLPGQPASLQCGLPSQARARACTTHAVRRGKAGAHCLVSASAHGAKAAIASPGQHKTRASESAMAWLVP